MFEMQNHLQPVQCPKLDPVFIESYPNPNFKTKWKFQIPNEKQPSPVVFSFSNYPSTISTTPGFCLAFVLME